MNSKLTLRRLTVTRDSNKRKLDRVLSACLLPIVEHSHVGSAIVARVQWTIFVTFFVYSPIHVYPHVVKALMRWFQQKGFDNNYARRGFDVSGFLDNRLFSW